MTSHQLALAKGDVILIKDASGVRAVKLLLGANGADAVRLERKLRLSKTLLFEVSRIDTLTAVLNIPHKAVDAFLLDLSSSSPFNQADFADIHSHFPQTPILLIVDSRNETVALALTRQGAADYLVKGHFSPLYLTHVITLAIERNRSEATENEAQQRLELAINHAGIV